MSAAWIGCCFPDSRSTASRVPFPKSVFMTFQMTFAIITPALIVGASSSA